MLLILIFTVFPPLNVFKTNIKGRREENCSRPPGNGEQVTNRRIGEEAQKISRQGRKEEDAKGSLYWDSPLFYDILFRNDFEIRLSEVWGVDLLLEVHSDALTQKPTLQPIVLEINPHPTGLNHSYELCTRSCSPLKISQNIFRLIKNEISYG